MLLEDDMAVTDVAEPFEMSLAAISKHLTILAAAGLISQEKRGRVKWCKLEPDALKRLGLDAGVRPVRAGEPRCVRGVP
jgi:DNA-binding transcriptional ArsR family regulator